MQIEEPIALNRVESGTAEALAAQPEPTPQAQGRLSSPEPRLRTMIVDDEPIAREVLRRLLRTEPDIEIVGVSNSSREAVKLINHLQPHLVFMDVQMPELDGFGVLREIQTPRPPAIVFVSANDTFIQRAFEERALDYVVKPCTRRRLQIALERARTEIRRLRQTEAAPVGDCSLESRL